MRTFYSLYFAISCDSFIRLCNSFIHFWMELLFAKSSAYFPFFPSFTVIHFEFKKHKRSRDTLLDWSWNAYGIILVVNSPDITFPFPILCHPDWQLYWKTLRKCVFQGPETQTYSYINYWINKMVASFYTNERWETQAARSWLRRSEITLKLIVGYLPQTSSWIATFGHHIGNEFCQKKTSPWM